MLLILKGQLIYKKKTTLNGTGKKRGRFVSYQNILGITKQNTPRPEFETRRRPRVSKGKGESSGGRAGEISGAGHDRARGASTEGNLKGEQIHVGAPSLFG